MPGWTIVYDQDCGVCQASVDFLRKRDAEGHFRFVGNESPELPADISRELTSDTVIVVDNSGKQFVRGAAVSQLLRAIPGFGWHVLGNAIAIPGIRTLADLSYRVFARHRHEVSAKLGLAACAVPAKK